METSEVVARVSAAAVGMTFAVAAASKFIDFRGWSTTATRQGIPRAIAVSIPPLEMLLGVALVAAPVTAFMLGATTVLLLVFTAFIVVSLATGRRAPCACFGSRSRRDMSSRDVARNVALIALLAVAAALA